MRTTLLAASLFLAACAKPAAETPPTPPSGPLAAGTVAPAIDATAHDGSHVTLASLKGKPVVLYFYPKDDTPGCTIEAQAFRDSIADFKAVGATIIGVSTQDNTSHQAFAEKHELPFLLLPDTDHKIAQAYGVDTSKGYAARVTFVIAPDGKVAKTFPEVKVQGHDAEVLAAVKATL
jgi:thioredoxin-dependent peroxiredoxin